MSDESIVSKNDLYQKLGYQNSEEALSSGVFVPLFRTDISELEKEFLLNLNLKRVLEKLKNTPDFDISFREYIDKNGLFQDWFQFESCRLRENAINWCHQYGIQYVDDERDYSPANIWANLP